jgi:hypothetical protein
MVNVYSSSLLLCLLLCLALYVTLLCAHKALWMRSDSTRCGRGLEVVRPGLLLLFDCRAVRRVWFDKHCQC